MSNVTRETPPKTTAYWCASVSLVILTIVALTYGVLWGLLMASIFELVTLSEQQKDHMVTMFVLMSIAGTISGSALIISLGEYHLDKKIWRIDRGR